ncbi:ABC transporter permease [Microtetraspora sp. NBRC 16547]|uniref:ABC transporter permease n=1 Tax=Microtetraspora sp. NBRC 16547 TaxID=3030993 RepID=UPI0024A5D0B8|nr:ABC transporter permease [Microtetraspora sp. NBRC 16547]GLX02397.1 peptide ABC transporter permease [Microtetraspora sp. NBRC 16547]
MLRFIIRRLGALAATLLISSFLIFAAMYAAPGSPESFLVQGRTVSPEVLASIRAQYGLDDPFLVRYGHWLGGVLTGDLGESLTTRQDVASLLASRIPTTLWLTAYAAVLIVVFGVVVGAIAGLRGGAFDTAVLLGSSVGFAIPTFFAAVLLMSVFSVTLGWFPVFGSGSGLADRMSHLTLPAVALALPAVAVVARITRTAVVEEREAEHVQIALARGVPWRIVARRHIVRNAMLPVTTIVGVNIAALVAGAAVVEHAFTLDGIGAMLINAVQQKDFAVVQAIALVLVAVFGVVNLVIDILYAVIDPRVQLGGESA